MIIDTVDVDLGEKLERRRIVRVALATLDLQGVHAVLERCPRGPDDHARPVRQCHVVVLFETPRDGTVADALLAGLQLLQEPEVTGDHDAGGHCRRRVSAAAGTAGAENPTRLGRLLGSSWLLVPKPHTHAHPHSSSTLTAAAGRR